MFRQLGWKEDRADVKGVKKPASPRTDNIRVIMSTRIDKLLLQTCSGLKCWETNEGQNLKSSRGKESLLVPTLSPITPSKKGKLRIRFCSFC